MDTPFANPDFYVHEVLVPWDESSTWNSLGNGLSVPEDLGDRVATFLGDNDPSSDFGRSMDVTALVQRWSDGQPTGVAILPEIVTGNDDGISIWTSEASNGMIRPRLEVTFEREIEPPTPSRGSGRRWRRWCQRFDLAVVGLGHDRFAV